MDKFIRNPTEGRLVDSISGEAVGRCVGELIDTLKDARACGMELPEGTVSSWMREMKRLGVSDKAIPLFLAAAQSAAYGDDG